MFVCAECGQSMPAQGHCPADGTPLTPIGEDLLLGTQIGAYRIARLLGIGGMGRVYKGVHPTIGSRVAIKVLSRECTDRRDLVERFFAEARAVNLIRHESIVNVLDLAVLTDGRPYIVMEYLDGAPLTALIEHALATQQPLPLGGLARLAAEVLDALAAAHAKSIVHRDLKPDNIFVAPSGRPKVLDFGIAKLSDPGHGPGMGSTRTGSLLGTPHYMSSEQAAGRPVDHRADLYAMGVMLFECATGRKPFLAEALFDLLRMHVEAPPPSPRALRPDMPVELEQVIMTALAKAPDQRFASAMAMSQALQHATAQLPADQWRTLTPPATRPTGNSWAPTPPSAWANPSTQPWSQASTQPAGLQSTLPASSQAAPPPGSSQAPQASQPSGTGVLSRTATMPPSRPAPMPAPPPSIPPVGQVSTVSDGQVTQRARPGRRARWIGLIALVVGGGAAGRAVFDHGRSRHGEEERYADRGDHTASGDPWGATGASGAPPSTEPSDHRDRHSHRRTKAERAAENGDDKDDKDDDESDADRDGETPAGRAAADPLADAYRQVDEALKALPPAQRKQLAGYRNLAKLPPEQRLKKLQQLMQLGIPGLEAPDAAAIARAAGLAATGSDGDLPAPPAVPPPSSMPAPPAVPTPPTPPVHAAPSPWITNESIDPPAGYDPERVDVTAFVAWSIQRAHKAIPDAQLIRVDASGVGPDGRANLVLATLASDHGSVDVRFISPSRGKRDPSQPLGVARHDFNCEFRVMAEPDGVELMPINFADCSKEHPVPAPRCSLGGVWKKAEARKAPHNAVGNIGYRANGAKPVWYFDIGAGFDVSFSQVFSDDC